MNFDGQHKNNNINLSDIKDKIILSEFAKSALGLKVTKNNTMCCHIHSETTPSLHLNNKKKFYYCFGCHKSGDVFSLIQEIKNMSFLESVKFAASYCGVNIDETLSDYNFLRNSSEIKEKKEILYKMMEDISIYFENALYESSSSVHNITSPLNYLYNRKIDNSLIKKFRIGYCPKNIEELIKILKNKYHENIYLILDSGIFKKKSEFYNINQEYYSILQNRIIFPIFDKFNKIIAFGGRIFNNQGEYNGKKLPKYINASDSLIFKKNENLYGENFALIEAKSKNKMIVCEGYIDVIMMHKASIQNCVAPLGTALQENQIKSIWNICDEITLCMDGDSAGYKSMIRCLDISMPIMKAGKFINFCFLDKDKDPADFIEQDMIDELKNIIENKKKFPSAIIFSLALQKYKDLKIESIAAIKSFLNLYIDMINDEIIKNEYKIYFEKRTEALLDQINKKILTPNILTKSNNLKNNFDNIDEIFFYLVILLEKNFEDCLKITEKNKNLLYSFFKNKKYLIILLE